MKHEGCGGVLGRSAWGVISAALSEWERASTSGNMEVVRDSAGVVSHLRSLVAIPSKRDVGAKRGHYRE
jgi:hypothetical protein